MNLTEQMAAQYGLPRKVIGTLDARADSQALSASPLRSKHEGKLSLLITDGSGMLKLAEVHLEVGGESAGSPDEGLGIVIRRFMDAGSLVVQPLPPATRPSNP